MKCSNCFYYLKESDNFCPNCGTPKNKDSEIVNTEGQEISTEVSTESINKVDVNNDVNNDGKVLAVVSLLLYFGGEIILRLFRPFISIFDNDFYYKIYQALVVLLPLSGIVLIIIAKIKYPKSKIVKIAFLVMILSVVVIIGLAILFLLMCYITCSNMNMPG